MSKVDRKKTSAKQKNDASHQTNTWLRRISVTIAKLAFAGLCALGIFVIYLDAKVQKTFEGERWQVPVQVYGQIQVLSVGEQVNLKNLVHSLRLNGYQKVANVTSAKQFAQSAHRLIIFQDNFDFPKGNEHSAPMSAHKITLDLDKSKNGIHRINALFSNDRLLSTFNLSLNY